ncbi:transcriptional regulator with XRE-family HTH domain [Actinopolyspora biskrensis]|uniref:Transcriptional regulator with XRE-family HTH domain n=1 Tax=Actinopolyspora biskrensis TaxID=1470178 RepID=A0A852Z9R0_9ACTN|nr:transcriptional regulator with XRE-family HTH domain [Actinopolyspora biskrensis]
MGEGKKLRQIGLGVQLRELREKSGMTTRSVASSLGLSPASVNRTELGQRLPGRDEMNALCALYGVTGEQKLLLVQRATEDSTAWLEMASGEPDQLASLMTLEREASAITSVEIALIPGLAQTSDYSRRLIATSDVTGQDPEHRVATRLSRQAVLSRPDPPRVTFLIDESALHRTLGNVGVVKEQLEHLLVIQRRENVVVRVVPLSSAAHPALDGAFSLYELPDGSAHVYVEARYFGVFLTEPADVGPYIQSRWDLEEHALDEQSSRELIAEVMGRMSDE